MMILFHATINLIFATDTAAAAAAAGNVVGLDTHACTGIVIAL